MSICDPGDWLQSPLGQYVLEREYSYFDQVVANVFGYYAVQLGLPELEFLRNSRIPTRVSVAPGEADLRADLHHLPFEGQSLDLALLPHVLEFAESPHQILREVERVLRPEGQLILAGFNPWSLWGARRLFDHSGSPFPWEGRFISLTRIKDWLALLGFEVIGGKLGCYAPPFRQEKWLRRAAFMDKAGDRWWPLAAGIYFVQAKKRVPGMRIILPSWNERLGRRKALAPAAQKATAVQRSEDAREGQEIEYPG